MTALYNSRLQPAGRHARSEAKKRPWPPWRLIATLPNSKFPLTHSKYMAVTFSNRNPIPAWGQYFSRLFRDEPSADTKPSWPLQTTPLHWWNFQPRRLALALE